MVLNVPLAVRRPKGALPRLWSRDAEAVRPDPSPVVMRRIAGCLVIEVRGAIDPAVEARIGRVLHGAIRPGGTGVLVDLRHTCELGASGISVLRLARLLAARRGLAFAFAGAPPVPELPYRPGEVTVQARPEATRSSPELTA